MKSLYEELGIGREATAAEVKKAYRRRAAETHPDKAHGSREAFQRVKLAGETLRDPVKRRRYDETGACDEAAAPVSAGVQLLAEMFTNFIGLEVVFEFGPVEALREALRMVEEKMAAHGRALQGKIRRVVQMQRRISGGGDCGVLEGVMASQLEAARQELAALPAQQVAITEAREILRAYRYEQEFRLRSGRAEEELFGPAFGLAGFKHSFFKGGLG